MPYQRWDFSSRTLMGNYTRTCKPDWRIIKPRDNVNDGSIKAGTRRGTERDLQHCCWFISSWGLPLGIFTTDTIEDLWCSSEEREGLSNGSISVLGIGHHSKPSILHRTKRKIVFGRDNKVRGWWNDLFRGTISFWAAWQPASSVALSLPTDNVQERSYFYWPPSTCIPLWCWMEIKELEFFTDISFQ